MVTREEALSYHREGRPGKIEIQSTKPSFTARDLSLAYSPGVAEPCLEIEKNKEDSFNYTARGNLVGVVTNGTAVLGLGNIGPDAAKPVMEGKAVLFKRFADIDCFDIEIAETDVDKFCAIVRSLEPTFGGINLEDIKAPECFLIEKRLNDEMDIPVFHDDQHGTAIICGAAFLNAMRISGKKAEDVSVVFSGAGAAAISCAKLLMSLGVREENVYIVDSQGVLTEERRESVNEFKKPFCRKTDKKTLADVMKGADVFCGLSIRDIVTPEMLMSMSTDPLVLAMANPDPEIDYNLARETRPDAIVGTGRSDYPNQVNNVLGFPFIFRGALDVRARKVNEEMKIAAVKALASLARQEVPEAVALAYGGRRFEFGPEYIIPKPMDPRVLTHVAPAVAKAACDTGVARSPITDWDDYREALDIRLGKEKEVLRFATHRAKAKKSRIVFPEGDFERILRATAILREEEIIDPVLVGPVDEIHRKIKEMDLGDRLDGVEIHEPKKSPYYEEFWQEYYKLRERKGITNYYARRRMTWRLQFASMMVRKGLVDGMVCGVGNTYTEMLRPVFALIPKTPEANHSAGVHLVLKRNEITFFADTTAVIKPTPAQIAETAWSTADLARRFDVEPRVALISFSTFGSVDHPDVDKVREALAIVRERRPDITIDGEMRVDTALMPEFCKEHYPFSQLGGKANVLIFPDVSTGNIAYKIAESFGGALVLGPFLTGLERPVSMLTRYATVDNILHASVMAAMLAVTNNPGDLEPLPAEDLLERMVKP